MILLKGGYGGGPLQLAHLAPTYAAVNSLVIVGTPEAYRSIDRYLVVYFVLQARPFLTGGKKTHDRLRLYSWLVSLKDVSGGFKMHQDGEVDIRGTYCALAVASLLNLVTSRLLTGVDTFLARCQTYEGGLGGFPGNEAHGGYTFCGIAAAVLAGAENAINLPLLLVRNIPFSFSSSSPFHTY